MQPKVFATDLVIGESARWREGRLWLSSGQLLIVAGPEQRLLRQEPDGSLVDHADLSGLPGGLNEIVVDGRGTIYVNGGADFYPDEGIAPASSRLLPRTVRCVKLPTESRSLTGWR